MRLLIVPASKHGGTAEIGRAIARRIRSAGIDVDVSQPEFAQHLERYDGFIIGSAIYEGSWLPGARSFVKDFGAEIRDRPTWIFSSGLLAGASQGPELSEAAIAELIHDVGGADHRFFGGRLRLEDLEPAARAIAAWVGLGDVDERNWAEINVWVDTIIEACTAGVIEPGT